MKISWIVGLNFFRNDAIIVPINAEIMAEYAKVHRS
jgi:hypothetical protein